MKRHIIGAILGALGLLMAGVGCSGGVPEHVTAYGFNRVVNPAFDEATADTREKVSFDDAKRVAALGLYGARYEVKIAEDGSATTRISENATPDKITDATLLSRDRVDIPFNDYSWLVTTIEVPAAPHLTDTATEHFKIGSRHSLDLRLPIEAPETPVNAPMAALEKVIRSRYGNRPGTYRGVAYFTKVQPRMLRVGPDDKNAERRYAGETYYSTGETQKMVFEITVILADEVSSTQQ